MVQAHHINPFSDVPSSQILQKSLTDGFFGQDAACLLFVTVPITGYKYMLWV